MRRDQVLSTLGKISRIAGETLALRDVLIRVAKEAEAILPLDEMFVARLAVDGSLTLYSHTEEVPDHLGPVALNDFSPPLRPLLNEVRRVDDAKKLVDDSFFVNREIREKSVRSLLSAPLKRGDLTVGFVTVLSRRPHAFSEDHEVILLSIADILGLALEHERLWNLDLARRTRLEHVDAVMPIIANALNVGEIFEQVWSWRG
jgi:GAF domain-containing protein